MKIDGRWLHASATQAVCAALAAGGHRALVVGGCVRNALLGRPVADIDIATDALPETVMRLARAARLHPVPTGIEHGTITVVAEGRGFEVTTFRTDVETFGRHAVVAFSTDLVADASRRDFTMNALYAEADGTVIDPLDGLADVRARRVRFVGDPYRRIAEDYLRILRFFRIHAWYGDPEGGLDADGLAACAALQDGLDRLSRERVGAEVTKLLGAGDPSPAVGAMAATGILARILPGAEPQGLPPVVDLEGRLALDPRWQRRLAALGWRADWIEQLRLSRADARALAATAAALEAGDAPAAAAYRHGIEPARDAALIRAAALGSLPGPDLEEDLARGGRAQFPLRAADLPLKGPELGRELRRLEAAWLASDLSLDAAALAAMAHG